MASTSVSQGRDAQSFVPPSVSVLERPLIVLFDIG
eukprot:COSAG02_NODE_512_length_20850_cov_4.993302_16_plen_35_part_00